MAGAVGDGWREVVPGDAQGGPLDRERMDYALGACMMLASRAQNFGDRIGVVVFDERIRHVSPPRRADPPSLARTFAEVETRLVEPNYPLAFATLGRSFRKRSLVVLFCDIIDGSVSRALVQSLARIGRAHLPLAIAIQNPGLDAAAVRPAGNAADAYHRAAAEEMVQARAATLQVMRQAGILVVDTPARRHAGADARQVHGDQGARAAVARALAVRASPPECSGDLFHGLPAVHPAKPKYSTSASAVAPPNANLAMSGSAEGE